MTAVKKAAVKVARPRKRPVKKAVAVSVAPAEGDGKLAVPFVSVVKGDGQLNYEVPGVVIMPGLEPARFSERLHERGWNQCGGGAFGAVYSKRGSPTVWKVAPKDRGYGHFLALVASGALVGPHFPRVSQVYLNDNGTVIAELERLVPLNREGIKIVSTTKPVVYQKDLTADAFIKRYKLETGFGSMVEAMAALRDLRNRDARFDLHHGNFMMRGPVPVITDPFTDGGMSHEDVLKNAVKQRVSKGGAFADLLAKIVQ